MALFSEIDWLVLLGAAAFLLLGGEGRAVFRRLGRWYGRAMRLKQELLAEMAQSADLPAPPPGHPMTVRGILLGYGEGEPATTGIPVAVTSPPSVVFAVGALTGPSAGALGAATWVLARPGPGIEGGIGP